MATVFRSARRYRVAVNSNDHPPPQGLWNSGIVMAIGH